MRDRNSTKLLGERLPLILELAGDDALCGAAAAM